jgi:hypothetical protein
LATGVIRKLILNVHIYGGLLCFSYLILFGVTTLMFNHPLESFRARGTPATREMPIQLPASGLPRITSDMTADQKVAAKVEANNLVARAIGVFGYARPWQQSYWVDPQHYHASIVQPGREYEVDVDLDRHVARVTETPQSAWNVLRGLHGLHGQMPGSAVVSSWRWYTELCTFAVLFAGASGVYLWTRRRSERRIGAILLGSATALSLALMIYLVRHG